MTSRWGHKRKYRIIDFKRVKHDIYATVQRIEYDPNRSSFIALIQYEDGEKSYILAPQKVKTGDKVISGDKVDIKLVMLCLCRQSHLVPLLHNIELKPGKGGQLARVIGTYVQLIGRDQGYCYFETCVR